MSRSKAPELFPMVQSFFDDHLKCHCGASRNTIQSYRDTLKLLFNFLADREECNINKLRLESLDIESIKAFLSYIETERANSCATRNYRLAAIKGFFKHLIRQDISHADQYNRVLSIPSKRARTVPAHYLEADDIRLILRQPDCRTALGRRDYALLLFLYNTGARVSEAIAVTVEDLLLSRPAQVRLLGKGSRIRYCPIWQETVKALGDLKTVSDGGKNEPVFLNRNGQPLTRDGVAYILKKHVSSASHSAPALRRRHITPHSLRHSCAVGLLQSGVDVTVIRDYLGHVSVATTGRYITTNLRMKREALDVFWKNSGLSKERVPHWHPKPSLISFLESL